MKSFAELAVEDKRARAGEFCSLAHLMLRSGGGFSDVLGLAERSRNCSPRAVKVLKAAVSAGTMDDPQSSALVDLQIVANGFIASLARSGVFDRMLADGAFRRVPLATPGVRISSTPLTGYGVAEAAGKPVSRLTIGAAGLARLKTDCMIIVSDQLAENMTAAAQALVSTELRNGVIAATYGVFLAAVADGVSPVTASGGGGAAAALADLEALLAAVPTDATSRLYLVTSAAIAKRLAFLGDTAGQRAFPEMTPLGGTIAGIPVLVSDHLPAGSGSPILPLVMLIDAAQIAADSDLVTLDEARHASVEMVDDPAQSAAELGSPSAPTATTLVSLWQTNSRGLRASRYYGFKKLREDAVAVLENMGW